MVCEMDVIFFFQAEGGIRDYDVSGVQTCALPISWCARLRGHFEIVVSRWGVRSRYEICDVGKVHAIGCRPDAAEEDGT